MHDDVPHPPSRHRRAALPALALCAALLGACATAGIAEPDPLVDEVYEAIRLDPQLGASQVTVTNEGGVITLGGFVDESVDEQSIVDAASGVDGVTRVDNNITLSAGN